MMYDKPHLHKAPFQFKPGIHSLFSKSTIQKSLQDILTIFFYKKRLCFKLPYPNLGMGRRITTGSRRIQASNIQSAKEHIQSSKVPKMKRQTFQIQIAKNRRGNHSRFNFKKIKFQISKSKVQRSKCQNLTWWYPRLSLGRELEPLSHPSSEPRLIILQI